MVIYKAVSGAGATVAVSDRLQDVARVAIGIINVDLERRICHVFQIFKGETLVGTLCTERDPAGHLTAVFKEEERRARSAVNATGWVHEGFTITLRQDGSLDVDACDEYGTTFPAELVADLVTGAAWSAVRDEVHLDGSLHLEVFKALTENEDAPSVAPADGALEAAEHIVRALNHRAHTICELLALNERWQRVTGATTPETYRSRRQDQS